MKNVIVLVVMTVGLVLSANGQCTLTRDKAPTLGGASLGMTITEAISRYGRPFRQDVEHLGYVSTVPVATAAGVTILRPNNFEGISQLSLGLSGDIITDVLIRYDMAAVKWDSDREFADAISTKLELPTLWSTRNGKTEMWCDGFSLAVDATANSIWLVDLETMRKKLADDQKAATEKKRAFKP